MRTRLLYFNVAGKLHYREHAIVQTSHCRQDHKSIIAYNLYSNEFALIIIALPL